jgi:type IV secretion system protein VirD4
MSCNMSKSKGQFRTALPFFGYSSEAKIASIGFIGGSDAPRTRRKQPFYHAGNSHILTIGATGSGKTNLLIANLLQYQGSVIVIDIRGDAVRATQRFRREVLGQQTFVIDPFGVTGLQTDRLNPFDVIKLPGVEIESECQSIAATLGAGYEISRDPYWWHTASDLISAQLAYLLTRDDAKMHSFNALVELSYSDEPVYQHAVLLDTALANERQSFAYKGIAAWVNVPDGSGSTRMCILSTAHSMLHSFRSKVICDAMGSPSSIDLTDLLDGKPLSIYLVLPIERLTSHSVCLRLWLDVLLQVLMRRQVTPAIPTLVMVDEAAQIGPCPALKTVATYLRAHGVRLWTFWQDLSQLRRNYPLDWETLVNNTSALSFLPGNGLAARELAGVAGVSRAALEGLNLDQQLVCEAGSEPRIVDMAQYWKDRRFKGRFDQIPRFAKSRANAAAPRRPR